VERRAEALHANGLTALVGREEELELLLSVLYGFWVANYIAFDGDALCERAAQFLALAEKQGTAVPLMIAHRAMGISLSATGDIAQGRAQFDRAIALYDPTEHRALATRFGHDNRVAVLSYRSWALWYLGYPEAALADAEHALKDAREIGQAATLMYGLFHAPFPHILCGNYAAANALLDQLLALADDKGSSFWKAFGMLARGYISALTGKASDTVQTTTFGLSAFRSTASTLLAPLHLSYLARAYGELGQFDNAWRCIGEAVTTVEARKERWCEAEVHRTAGEIALMLPYRDTAKAEAHFERALVVARGQQAKSWELRAATSLARLRCAQGKRGEARDLLGPVYGWFTQGFDTLDLKDAKTFLEGLAPEES
jgi:predicted ATPase